MKTGWGILGVAALIAVTLPAAGCSTACPAAHLPGHPQHRQQGGRQHLRFTFILGPVPSHITLRALAADGSVLAEQVNDLEWTRDAPFNPCPGPVTTPPVVFLVGERSP